MDAPRPFDAPLVTEFPAGDPSVIVLFSSVRVHRGNAPVFIAGPHQSLLDDGRERIVLRTICSDGVAGLRFPLEAAPVEAGIVPCPPSLYARCWYAVRWLVSGAEDWARTALAAAERELADQCGQAGPIAACSTLVEDAKLLLARRYRARLPLAHVAELLDVSQFHLCRTFHRETGLGLHAWREQLRLRRALDMLVAPEADLTGIALELGFANHSHFAASFRRVFGSTASMLRAVISTSASHPGHRDARPVSAARARRVTWPSERPDRHALPPWWTPLP